MQQVKPTRMELLKLKRRLNIANRGWKLLKEKRDGLMKRFMEIIRQAKDSREKVEEKLGLAFQDFFVATSALSEKELFQIFALSNAQTEISVTKENIMSVWIPRFKAEIKGDFKCFSPLSAPAALEETIQNFWESLELMIKLAEVEHSARLLSFEIEKTRRRVNALEYVIVPQMQQQIKYISAKLDEQERADKIIKMKVKELVS